MGYLRVEEFLENILEYLKVEEFLENILEYFLNIKKNLNYFLEYFLKILIIFKKLIFKKLLNPNKAKVFQNFLEQLIKRKIFSEK
mgnify:CR=1 FL=1